MSNWDVKIEASNEYIKARISEYVSSMVWVDDNELRTFRNRDVWHIFS